VNINEVFKKYPDNEPNHKGTNYLTLTDVNGIISYSITYYNDNAEFEPKFGKVVAFTQTEPNKILNSLNQ
tara:strand:- start:11427 stop:11636 length:210 start_codon:yes stop_codon:yes gene_type:complete